MIEMELGDLGNAVRKLKGYENKDGLDLNLVFEDREFGVLENLNEVYKCAKALLDKYINFGI